MSSAPWGPIPVVYTTGIAPYANVFCKRGSDWEPVHSVTFLRELFPVCFLLSVLSSFQVVCRSELTTVVLKLCSGKNLGASWTLSRNPLIGCSAFGKTKLQEEMLCLTSAAPWDAHSWSLILRCTLRLSESYRTFQKESRKFHSFFPMKNGNSKSSLPTKTAT